MPIDRAFQYGNLPMPKHEVVDEWGACELLGGREIPVPSSFEIGEKPLQCLDRGVEIQGGEPRVP